MTVQKSWDIFDLNSLQEYLTPGLRNLDLVCWIYCPASTRGGSHSLFSPRTGIRLAPADIFKELRRYFCGRCITLSSIPKGSSPFSEPALAAAWRIIAYFQLAQVSQRMWSFSLSRLRSCDFAGMPASLIWIPLPKQVQILKLIAVMRTASPLGGFLGWPE